MNSTSDFIVREGRLLKKIEKLKKQRDHWKEQHDYYAKVISLQPYLERRWEDFEARRKEVARVKDLEKRVKEQEMLIRILSGDNVPDWEIKKAYDTIITKEVQKRNAHSL